MKRIRKYDGNPALRHLYLVDTSFAEFWTPRPEFRYRLALALVFLGLFIHAVQVRP